MSQRIFTLKKKRTVLTGMISLKLTDPTVHCTSSFLVTPIQYLNFTIYP